MNAQQNAIAFLGGLLILIQNVRNGLFKDIWGFVWGSATTNFGGAATSGMRVGDDFTLFVVEVALVFALTMFADEETPGRPTIGLMLILALWAVFIVVNAVPAVAALTDVQGKVKGS